MEQMTLGTDTIQPLGQYMLLEDTGYRDGAGHHVWHVRNKRDSTLLGVIDWYQSWKTYVFTPAGGHVCFNHVCLRDIARFLANRNAVRTDDATP